MRIGMLAVFGVALAGLPMMAGCEREIARETEVDVDDDGTVKKEQTTVTEHPDGSVSEKTTETRSNP